MSIPRSLLALAAFLAVQVSAHGGHEDVPEGEAISEEPTVSITITAPEEGGCILLTGRCAGLGRCVVDSHPYHGDGIRCDFSVRHGTWSKQFFSHILD